MTAQTPQADQAAPISSRRLAFGAGMHGLGNIVKVVLQLAMLPVMARLLGPFEFGLYALAMPTVSFLQMLADGGLGNSLARESESSVVTWSTAFWVLHGFCAALALVVIGWSFLLASFTHQPRLPPIMAALSISLLLLAASILPGARLTRRGDIGKGSGAEIVANCIGVAVGLFLALHKAGAWSLVIQYLVIYGTRTLLLNLAAFQAPRFLFDLHSLVGHFAVGGALVGGKLSDFFGRMIENGLLSTFLGAPALGAYSFGNQVPRFLCETFSNPVWASIYVRALRSERESALRSYYRLTRLLALLVIPMAAMAAVAAPYVIPFILGASWARVTPVILAILPSYAFAVVGAQSTPLLYAYGRSGLSFWIASAIAASRVLVVALSPFVGLTGVSVGIGLVCLLQGIVSIFVPAKAIGTDPWQVVRSLTSAAITAISVSAVLEVMLRYHSFNISWLFWSLIVSVIFGVTIIGILDRKKIFDDFSSILALFKRQI